MILFLGAALMALLAGRAQSGGDQLNLLSRGWLWAERGVLVPYGNPLSNGGMEPGPLTSLLVGLPLALWRHHRAPGLVVVLFHLLAYLILDRTIAKILSPRERLLFALVYWLNPWRLYYSGFLWNPNYLALPAALHLWTSWLGRRGGRFWPSLGHVLAIGAAGQLHPSALILLLATVVLLWRRALVLEWRGVACGVALVLFSLIPWLRAVAAAPEPLLPGGDGFLLRGLLYVFPLIRGWLYWLRYGALNLPGAILRLDFVDVLGVTWNARLAKPLERTLEVLLPMTLAPPVWANLRLLRRARRYAWRPPASRRPRVWLCTYVLSLLLAATVSFALSPTTIMPWQAFIAFHAAVLPLVFAFGALWRLPRFARGVRRGAVAWGAVAVLLTPVLAFGSRHYRCHGPESMGIGVVLRHDHPMFHDLGWSGSCPPRFDAELGWWPDVLPER
ncbi:MAG: hypothetical protein AB7G12_00875 [Thermoanaerobaculia bacterium]